MPANADAIIAAAADAVYAAAAVTLCHALSPLLLPAICCLTLVYAITAFALISPPLMPARFADCYCASHYASASPPLTFYGAAAIRRAYADMPLICLLADITTLTLILLLLLMPLRR